MLNIFNMDNDMSFKEKSAWLMLLALGVATALYTYSVILISKEIGQLVPPIFPSLIAYTVILVIIAVIGHILLAVLSPKDASSGNDEREKIIFARAGSAASFVMGFCIVISLGIYLFTYNGHLLFYTVFGSLILSQLFEYVAQIFYFRSVLN